MADESETPFSGTRSNNVEFDKDTKREAATSGHHGHIHRRLGAHFHRPHLFHPNGRKIHIAHSPAHAEDLRRQLSHTSESDEIDLVIHGTQEHIDALREISLLHEDKKAQLREKHGSLCDEIENLVQELDHISAELSAMTEHAVQLDANFSKYGYDAHIRTHDNSPLNSSNTSLYGERRSSKDEWAASKHQGDHMKFYMKPILRQYFHKGVLWRAQENEEVMPYELFFDLIYVGIIAITGDSTVEETNGHSLLRFAITFIMSWKVWSDVTIVISWFDSNDMIRRFFVVFMLASLVGFTSNVMEFYHEAYTPLVGFYLAGRFGTAIHFLWASYLLPIIRRALIANVVMILIPAALWIGSIHVPEYGRQALIWPAICLDLFGMVIFMIPYMGHLPGQWRDKARSFFEAMPATNIEHRIERTGAFVTLVFGYSVVALLYQSRSEIGVNAFFGKAILGMMQAFAFNWLYFEIDQFNIHVHAIRRHAFSSMVWFSLHLPFIMGFVLAGASLSRLVLSHDAPGTSEEYLSEHSLERSDGEIPSGQRWFYCGGLGVALFCMNLISLTHSYKSPEKGYRIHKHVRLGVRFAVSFAFIGLGAAESLNSVELIATTTSMIIFALICELYGHGVKGYCWRMRERRCKYSARCNITRKELEESVKAGTVLKVSELGVEKGNWDLNF